MGSSINLYRLLELKHLYYSETAYGGIISLCFHPPFSIYRTGKCTTTWSTSWKARILHPCPITTSQRSFTGQQSPPHPPTSFLGLSRTQRDFFSFLLLFLSSKPLRPTTQGSKALPFIKVIEIKS